jgi:hypothetical protein
MMPDPMICPRCEKEIVPGDMVEFVTDQQPIKSALSDRLRRWREGVDSLTRARLEIEERGIFSSSDTIVIHADCIRPDELP